MLKVYFDGLCEPVNPGGVATWGFVVFKANRIIFKDCGLAGIPFRKSTTNNLAEYTALLKAASWCVQQKAKSVKFYGDSMLVVNQVNGIYRVKSENMAPLYLKVMETLKGIKNYSVEWIPREKNTVADELTKAAYEDFMQKGGILKMPMPFGKYKGIPIEKVAQHHPRYFEWLVKNVEIKDPIFKKALESLLKTSPFGL